LKKVVGIVMALLLSFVIFPEFSLPAVRRLSGPPPAETGGEPETEPETEESDQREAVLYFQFGETDYLGAARTQIDLRQEETVATTIVRRLIEGPGIRYDRLHGLFPEGTQLISAVSDGTTVFVTLNRAFLDRPDGAPLSWEDSEIWQAEAARRRTMAMQSIVLSLTENAETQRVQLYVADADDEIGQRLQMAWFDPSVTDPQVYLGACGRDERICLSVHNTMQAVLKAWKQHDWSTLALFLNRRSGGVLDAEAVGEKMETLGIELLDYTLSEGVVSLDGSRATIVLSGTIQSSAGEVLDFARESCLLIREDDNWTIESTTLDRIMVRD